MNKIWNEKVQFAIMHYAVEMSQNGDIFSLDLNWEFSPSEKHTFCHWEQNPISVVKTGY